MVVYIAEQVFRDALTDGNIQVKLKKLFSMFEDEQHTWYVKPSDDEDLYFIPALSSYFDFIREEISESYKRWSNGEPGTLVRIYTSADLAADYGRLSGKASVMVSEVIPGGRVLAESGARRHEIITPNLIDSFLMKPLHIVVENSEFDGYFLRMCFRHMAGFELNTLFVDVVSGGGSTLRNIVEGWAGKRRVFCMIDGDIIAPGVVHPSKAGEQTELQQVCDQYGYVLHILKKRAIENYLPDSAIQRHRKIRRHAYFSLTATEKDCFHMKDGYDPNNCPAGSLLAPVATRAGIAASSQGNTDIPGFGSKIWRAFTKVANKRELLTRDQTGEIDDIVNAIRRLA